MFVLLFLMQLLSSISTPICEVYINNNEFVCFCGDTISFRISNKDAFGTYTIGKGEYKLNKKGKLCLKDFDLTKSLTSYVNKYPNENRSIVLTAVWADSTPVKFATVNLKTDKLDIQTFSNAEGKVYLTKEQAELVKDVEVELVIESVGFKTKKTMTLLPGFVYVFRSSTDDNVPSLPIEEEKKIYFEFEKNILKVKTELREHIVLKEYKKVTSCDNLLFGHIEEGNP